MTVQIKKAIVFIQTVCLHEPTPEELAALPPAERDKWKPDAIERLKPEELATLRHDTYSGTGFLVVVPDERFGKDMGFKYLVTNRHVAQPGIEDGRPCKALGGSIYLNHKGMGANDPVRLQMVSIDPNHDWEFPEDPAVDLAVTSFFGSEKEWDFETIPLNLFVSQDMVDRHEVVEGDPVLFAGLFIQYAGLSRLEPIVRSGAVAMLPTDLLPTTLHRLGRIYLAEVHSFGGNSGSPMFVDTMKFRTVLGTDYRFLGVVTGEVFESNDFALQVSTSFRATVAANSNVSVVVPAEEVRKLLFSPKLQAARDREFTSLPKQGK